MQLTYEKRKEGVSVEWKKSVHVPPHLHEAIEIIYVTDGTVELGVGQELFHMEKGDFAIVFPNVIHHYQVFGSEKNKAIYLFLEPSLTPGFFEDLQRCSPEYPIISKDKLHVDIVNSVKALVNLQDFNPMIIQAYAQIILAHVFSDMEMVDKDAIGGDDIIYRAVEYVAKNFREEIFLDKMAYDLGVSKYVLSRLFAKTFHCNFNKYVNSVRLNYAASALENTSDSITTICLEAGFESQRTFNRVFKERYKVTPREYRVKLHDIRSKESVS
ncbi:MAG: helix-turn-helix domain-containing protein [Lachnospiraceae bacterium]|nr:helix-turn-helix domain-containing protein [Lachnospiraceae bacterium]